MKMNFPNKLTTLRLGIAPFFFIFFIYGGKWGKLIAFIIYAVIESTDFLDGFMARRHKQITDFGKIFDPFADSLSRFTYFITFLTAGFMPGWMVLIIFYRDSTVSTLRLIASLRGSVVAARISGKIKAEAQAIGVFIVLSLLNIKDFFRIDFPFDIKKVIYYVFLIVTLVTLYSAVDYTIGNFYHVKKIKK
jgi:CDP-diacylglycerol--glycerol-3-phosphate 3-phosphatidyltransferase